MGYRTVTFQEVSCLGTKSGDCVICGKHAKRKAKFFQTMNPFNKGGDGLPKSRDQIQREIAAECNAWQNAPVIHSKCFSAIRWTERQKYYDEKIEA